MALINRFIRSKRLNMILRELKKDWKIIDIGCGDGWLTKALRDMGFNCIGVDAYLEKWGKKECSYIKKMDIVDSCFNDKEFDCSILIEVIEHLTEDRIRETERITKKKIIVSTHIPNIDWFFDTLGKLHVFTPPGSPIVSSYKVNEIPFKNFKLDNSRKYYFMDQFAVFTRASG
jgi:2-polyprenyl-3-methyl-5-hydroxy-6-metoxy-1,4-benzoquinol methylase